MLLLIAGGCGDAEQPSVAGPVVRPVSWFTEITGTAGVEFVHESGANVGLLLPPIMGSGTALFDYDADGDLDLYFVTGKDVPNRLFRQEADGRFLDVTAASGLGDTGFGMGVAVGDYDNDGHPDVLVTNLGPDSLYHNLGDGTFADVTSEAGVDVDGWSCSAAFVDYDRDGFLDLFITQYVAFDASMECFDRAGRPDYCGPKVFRPVPDVLLHNNGDGTFTNVSAEAGIASVAAAGLGVVCEDLDEDGWVDIYVANDAYPNHLWLNRGDPGAPGFEEVAVIMGAAYNLHGKHEAGMGVIAADLNNDASPDLFVTHLHGETNTLYRNLGNGSGLMDVTGETSLGPSSLGYTGFGTAALDVELDGDLDLVVVNGRVNRMPRLPGAAVEPPLDVLAEPNLLYANDGHGRFELKSLDADTLSRPLEISRGLATGDLDNDGDLDLVVSNVHGPARVYRNDASRRGHWLTVAAMDPALRRNAIGARIVVHCGGQRHTGSVRRSFSYLSSSDPRVNFGLGPAERVDRIEVRWPDGLREDFGPVGVDRFVQVIRGRGVPAP